ncbi:CatA-like O-acetyltransferase [Flammeovirgaceae bacterium SG7u.111]|nr:CatA-like O-acetyltransferase [Flammeovirgaceae bacterium SG7u.132]WPO37951.1 CatA-like O-acetyltransferase [Flammeovirgaceae bacterium SG7u.111]
MDKNFELINIETWPRKKQFLFFKEYEQPFFELCVNVEATPLFTYCKEHRISFFQAYMFLTIKASNRQPEFRLRIIDGQIRSYHTIGGGTTVLNPDETFSFCYFDYLENFKAFRQHAEERLEENRRDFGKLNPQDHRADLIHYSTIPWLAFTSMTHAYRIPTKDSIPKIVFGKYHEEHGKGIIPVAVKVHHALMDALHVAKFVQLLESYFNNPETSLA